MIMKKHIAIFFVMIYFSCATPKLIVQPKQDETKMEQWFSMCMSDKDTIGSHTAKIHYASYCREEARRLYTYQDSTIVMGKKIYQYSTAPKRIKNKITNIVR